MGLVALGTIVVCAPFRISALQRAGKGSSPILFSRSSRGLVQGGGQAVGAEVTGLIAAKKQQPSLACVGTVKLLAEEADKVGRLAGAVDLVQEARQEVVVVVAALGRLRAFWPAM